MKPHDVERVFGHERLRMATGEHVEVFREAAAPGERRRYTKRFLATGDADFRQWTDREWRILARLIGHGARCVPDVVQFENRHGGGRQVQTYDAGITIDQWATLLPVTREGVVRRHVFEDCAHWWALARHCIAALDEIHALGLVHLDVKADNICVPYGPDDFDAALADARLHVVFERLALIDFAFSVATGEPLATALPIGWQKDYDYQSPRLLRALEAGIAGDLAPTRALDWRCDLYSLAAMLRRYLPDDAWARGAGAAAGWTARRYDDARALVYRLREAHDRDLPLPGRRPHRALLDAASEALEAADLQGSLQTGWTLARDVEVADPLRLATPLTRIAPARVVADARGHAPAPATLIEAWRDAAPATAVTAAPAVFRTTRIRVIATPAAVPAARVTRVGVPRGARAVRAALVIGGVGALAAVAASLVADDGRPWPSVMQVLAALRGPDPHVVAQSDAAATAPAGDAAVNAMEDAAETGGTDGAVSAADTTATDTAEATPPQPSVQEGAGSGAAATAPPDVTSAESAGDPRPAAPPAAVSAGGERPAEPSPGVPTVAEAAPPAVAAEATPAEAHPVQMSPEPPRSDVAARDASSPAQKALPPAQRPLARGKPGASAPSAGPARLAKTAPAPMSPAQRTVSAASANAKTARAGLATSTHTASGSAPIARAPVTPPRSSPPGTPPVAAAVAAASPGANGSSAPAVPATTVAAAAVAGTSAAVPAATTTVVASSSAAATSAATETAATGTPHAAAVPEAAAVTTAPAAVETPRAAPARGSESARTVTRSAPRQPWQLALRDVMTAFGIHEQRAAPVEERSVARPPEPVASTRPPERPPVVAAAITPPAHAAARAADDARIVPAPMPRAEAPLDVQPPGVRAIPAPTNVAAGSAVADGAGDDLRTQGVRVLREVLPRTAAQARADIAGVLGIAASAETTGQNRAVYDAAVTRMASENAYVPTSAGQGRARQLHAEARQAFAWGRDANATDLALRAFAANPRDADIAGFLAFLELRSNPETARQLALHALAFSGPSRARRDDDWNTLAVASALTGREADATHAFMVELALTRDVDRTCRAALGAYGAYGERLRAPVQALLYRVRVQGRDYTAASCAWPGYRTASR